MTVKFGVFADLHVDIIHDPQARLEAFLEACHRESVDFIIQLGDFCYPESRHVVCRPENMPVNIRNALCTPTYADKDAIICLFREFEKPSYHVLGNHDCDMCSKQAVLHYYGVDYGPYYSFDRGGFHFVVLDPNYYLQDGRYISFDHGNYFDASGAVPAALPYLPPDQLDWLEADLRQARYPTVLFSHQRLTEDATAIRNADALRHVLRGAPKGVVLALNGHEHMDNARLVDGTWFVGINSMSNYWLGEQFRCDGRYGPAIDEKWPNIRYTVPYTQPPYAIITLDPHGAAVKGAGGEFVGITPEDQGVYAPGSPIGDRLWSPITPSQTDRRLPFDL